MTGSASTGRQPNGRAPNGPPSSGPAERRAARGWLRPALRLALLAACLLFIARFFATQRDGLLLLREVRPLRIGLLALLLGLYFAVHAVRFRLVIEQCSGRSVGFLPWLRLFVLGRFLNVVVPQSGNLYRGLRLKADHGVGYTRYVTGFLSFAWLDTCLNFVLGAAVLAAGGSALRLAGAPAWAVVAALAALVAAAPFAIEALVHLVPARRGPLLRLHEKVAEMLRVSNSSVRDRGYLARALATGVAGFAVSCAALQVAFDSLAVPVDLSRVILFYVVLKLSNHISLTPGNLGVQELGFGLLGEHLGVGMGEGIMASALLRVAHAIVLFALAIPLGGIDALRRRAAGAGEEPDP